MQSLGPVSAEERAKLLEQFGEKDVAQMEARFADTQRRILEDQQRELTGDSSARGQAARKGRASKGEPGRRAALGAKPGPGKRLPTDPARPRQCARRRPA